MAKYKVGDKVILKLPKEPGVCHNGLYFNGNMAIYDGQTVTLEHKGFSDYAENTWVVSGLKPKPEYRVWLFHESWFSKVDRSSLEQIDKLKAEINRKEEFIKELFISLDKNKHKLSFTEANEKLWRARGDLSLATEKKLKDELAFRRKQAGEQSRNIIKLLKDNDDLKHKLAFANTRYEDSLEARRNTRTRLVTKCTELEKMIKSLRETLETRSKQVFGYRDEIAELTIQNASLKNKNTLLDKRNKELFATREASGSWESDAKQYRLLCIKYKEQLDNIRKIVS